MRRPAGVIVLALLYAIGAFCLFGMGLLLTVGSSFMAAMVHGMGPLLTGIGTIGGVFMLGMAVLLAFVAYGLFQMREWARIAAMVFAGFGLVASMVSLFTPLGLSIVGRVVRIAINALILWYLNQPNVRGLFGRQ
jgi:hypothetical protein